MKEYICPKCECKITYEDVVEGYFGVCLECDEDFYEFELIEINQSPKER